MCCGQFLFSSLFLSFQTSLAFLMTTLGQSHPYFVRCVKPNEKKVCPAVSAFFSLVPWLKVWMGVPRKCFFSYESKEVKFCAVFRIDLDSISALHFSVVDTFKGKRSVYGISIFLPASSVLQPEGSPQPAQIFRNVGNGQDSSCRFSCQTNIWRLLVQVLFFRLHTLVNNRKLRPPLDIALSMSLSQWAIKMDFYLISFCTSTV